MATVAFVLHCPPITDELMICLALQMYFAQRLKQVVWFAHAPLYTDQHTLKYINH